MRNSGELKCLFLENNLELHPVLNNSTTNNQATLKTCSMKILKKKKKVQKKMNCFQYGRQQQHQETPSS